VAISRLPRYLVGTFALCYLSAIALVGCGSSSSNTTASTPAAAATACGQRYLSFRPAIGTIQSITGQTVHITESNGGSINATYSNTTHITQEALATTSALQKGANVSMDSKQVITRLQPVLERAKGKVVVLVVVEDSPMAIVPLE
jgi:hypothetical protein